MFGPGIAGRLQSGQLVLQVGDRDPAALSDLLLGRSLLISG
jgi:hypothetical protein